MSASLDELDFESDLAAFQAAERARARESNPVQPLYDWISSTVWIVAGVVALAFLFRAGP